MFNNMKYVEFADGKVVIFQEHITHSDLARNFGEGTPISAGFVYMHDYGSLRFSGNSFSLKLDSNPALQYHIAVFTGYKFRRDVVMANFEPEIHYQDSTQVVEHTMMADEYGNKYIAIGNTRFF